MKVYGVIMAGGGGTRFWPLSRSKMPKQLLNLSGKESMVNEAIDRLSYVADKDNIFIVTNCDQEETMSQVTKERIRPENILSEPSARNTAACIGYAAMEILKKHGDGIMVVTPSDHYISDQASFTRILNTAISTADQKDKLVTIGITPTFPATGFGYIRFCKEGEEDVKAVMEFREKPDEETAKEYIATGSYAWNSGMFIWKASVILKAFEQYIPDIYEDLETIGASMNTEKEKEVIGQVYPDIRKISVDYAIMEPSAAKGDVYVVPGEFGWNDVGSWDMMDILNDTDSNNNVMVGDTIAINTTNSVLYSSGRLVSAVGVDNLVVVETPDAIMVCDKRKAQDVRQIVDALQAAGRKELL